MKVNLVPLGFPLRNIYIPSFIPLGTYLETTLLCQIIGDFTIWNSPSAHLRVFA